MGQGQANLGRRKGGLRVVASIGTKAAREDDTLEAKSILVTPRLDNSSLLLKSRMTGSAKIFCGKRRIAKPLRNRPLDTVVTTKLAFALCMLHKSRSFAAVAIVTLAGTGAQQTRLRDDLRPPGVRIFDSETVLSELGRIGSH